MNNRVVFQDWVCDVQMTHYAFGGPAVVLNDADDGSRVAVATVKLDEDPPDGCVWIKEYGENRGMTESLIKAGVIDPEIKGETIAGFVRVYAYKLLKGDW